MVRAEFAYSSAEKGGDNTHSVAVRSEALLVVICLSNNRVERHVVNVPRVNNNCLAISHEWKTAVVVRDHATQAHGVKVKSLTQARRS